MAEETQAPVAPQPFRLKQLLKAGFQPPPTQRATAANVQDQWSGTILAASETGFFSGKGNPEFDLVRACRNAIAGPARKLSSNTLRDYAKKARRLHAWQPDQESPPDIEAHCPSANSYYPYRAAARWAAKENCRKALRERDRAKPGTAERAAAIRVLQRSLATLNRYPPGTDAGIDKHQEQRALATLGLVAPPPQVPMDKRNPRATKAKLVGPLNRKIPDWSQKVWAQLVSVKSPWLAQVAAMALAGVRPEETSHVTISSRADGALVFHVRGAKVSDVKGQPERTITVRSDQPEFAFLSQQLATAGRELILKAPDGLKNPTEALGAAVRRAGATALGAHWGFSAYVYRHSLAADCKKDGKAREDLALVLGHSVTETSGLYGFWQGGRKGVRNISAVGTRVVKVNHHHGKVLPPSPSLPECGI